MLIRLKRDDQEILGSDGLLWVDGRLNAYNVKQEVLKRNKRYIKNFPHKIADSYYLVNKRIERISKDYKLIKLT